MFCTKCGAQIEDGAKFCTSCGQKVEETPAAAPVAEAAPAPEAAPEAAPEVTPAAAPEAAPAAEAAAPAEKKDALGELLIKAKALWATVVEKVKPALKKADDKAGEVLGDKKNYAYAGVLVLVGLILTISVIAAIIPDGNGYLATNEIQLSSNDDEICLFTEGKLVKIKTDAEGVSDFETSIDGEVIVFKYDGSLYQIKGKKAKAFAEEVKDYTLSLYGDSVVYTVVDGLETTYYYAKVGGKSVEIFANEIDLTDGSILSSYFISPDGKSVAYTVTEGLETDLYYFNGKKSTKVAGCDGKVVGMSNGGKYIYAVVIDEDLSTDLYVYSKNGKREKIDSCSSRFALNLDGTEIMFFDNDRTYISIKGKEAKKVASAEVSLILPRYTTTYSAGSSTVIYPIDSLYGHVYSSGSTAYFVAKKESKNVKLVNADSSRFTLDDSAEFLYYMDDETLMCLEIAKGENAKNKAKEIAEDVESYVITSDRKYLYYVSDNELLVVNGKKGGKPKTIEGDDVASRLVISNDDYVYYYCEDTLCATKGKSKGKAVLDEAECATLSGYVYILDEDAMYSARGKSKPKKILEND
jgi:hypothetical protein